MPAAIAIPLIAGVASSVIKGKMESSAAKKAAAIQVASQDKAQGYNQQVYNDQRQVLNPYVQAGTTALSKLMEQRYDTGGLSPGMRGTARSFGQQETPGSSYQPPAPGSMAPGMGPGPQPPNAALTGGGGPPPSGMPPGGGPNPLAQAMPQQGGGQPQGGPMVMMQSPDGETRPVPRDQAQHYISMGGKVVG